jgi:hypothetical protein
MKLAPRLRSSVNQEKAIAKDIGGRRVAGSGSQQWNKGDVKHKTWLVEAKQTVTGRFTISNGLWRKIEREAIRSGREPVIIIEMAGRKLALVDYNAFLAMKESL